MCIKEKTAYDGRAASIPGAGVELRRMNQAPGAP